MNRFLLPAAFLLAACSPQADHRGYVLDLKDVERIHVGSSTREEVREMMGTPSVTSLLTAVSTGAAATIQPDQGDGPYDPDTDDNAVITPSASGLADETLADETGAFEDFEDSGTSDISDDDGFTPFVAVEPEAVPTEVTWFYISSDLETSTFHEPSPTDRQILAILFNPEGIVDRVDVYDLSDAMEFDFSDEATPTYGTELNILQELLRNVGRFNQGAGGQ